MAQSMVELKDRLRGFESPKEASIIAKELKEFPSSQRKDVLNELIEIVHESVILGHPSKELLIPVACALVEYGDDQAIIDAFSASLSEMIEPNQSAAAWALCSTDSKLAFGSVASAARGHMARIPESMPPNATDTEKRALDANAIPTLQLIMELAKSDNPMSRAMADELRSDIVAKAEKSPLWQSILQGVNSEFEKLEPRITSTTRPAKSRPSSADGVTRKDLSMPWRASDTGTTWTDGQPSIVWMGWSILIVAICILFLWQFKKRK